MGNQGRWGLHAERVVTFARTHQLHQTGLLPVSEDVSFQGGFHS